MSHTDSIADLLTRIRNASRAGFPTTTSPYSVYRECVAKILCDEGYLTGVEIVPVGTRRELVVTLKYVNGSRPFSGLERVSKPGRRVYVGYNDIRPVRSGLGVTILSTPRGIVSDVTARKMKVGGEVICRVW